MKKIFAAALALLVTAVAVGWWRADVRRREITALLPSVPDLSSAPDALRGQIMAADHKARGWVTSKSRLAALSRAYHANGFLAEASRCYAGLRKIDPANPRWPHLAATILAGYGDLDAALPLWQAAANLAPDYMPARLRLGDALLKANRPAEAAKAYEAVLEQERDNAYAQLGLARLDFEAGRLDAARTRLEQVVSKTNYALGYDLIVTLYERLGLPQRAAAIRAMAKASGAYRDPADPWLDELIEDCFEPYRLSLAAGTVARNGDRATALRLLERAVAIVPSDVSARFQLGTLLVAEGKFDAAQEHLELCTQQAPDFADAWAHLSSLQHQQGRSTAAERTLAEGLKRCPTSPGLHLMLARRHQQAGRIGEAILEFQESIRLRPNEAEAYLELAGLYQAQNRENDALREIERALEAEPGNPFALRILAFHGVSTGDEATARDWIGRVRNQPRITPEQVGRLVAEYQKRFGRAP